MAASSSSSGGTPLADKEDRNLAVLRRRDPDIEEVCWQLVHGQLGSYIRLPGPLHGAPQISCKALPGAPLLPLQILASSAHVAMYLMSVDQGKWVCVLC
jgi:hypothetical protein